MLLVAGTTLTTFKNALDINDTAAQLSDANQNLRAGSNQLMRDLMMAGRIIANGGVPAPAGTGATPIARPAPPGTSLSFALVADDDGTLILPAITSGSQLGPTINGSTTDIVTILTVDQFMPVLKGLGANTPGTFDSSMAVIAADGSSATPPTTRCRSTSATSCCSRTRTGWRRRRSRRRIRRTSTSRRTTARTTGSTSTSGTPASPARSSASRPPTCAT